MGVGCEQAGVCYAEAHGQPERCGMEKQHYSSNHYYHFYLGQDCQGLYKDAMLWRKLVKASELTYPALAIAIDPENDKKMVYGKKQLEEAVNAVVFTKKVVCACCNGSGIQEVEDTSV